MQSSYSQDIVVVVTAQLHLRLRDINRSFIATVCSEVKSAFSYRLPVQDTTEGFICSRHSKRKSVKVLLSKPLEIISSRLQSFGIERTVNL
jgi:hypothetical protein